MAQTSSTPVPAGTPGRSAGPLVRDLEHPLFSIHREMSRLFDDVFHRRSSGSMQDSSRQYAPMLLSIDVIDTDKEIRICADLAGVSEDDIDVSLDGDVLTIRGEKVFEKKDGTENYQLVERSYGTFQRSLLLPQSVDPEKIRADFDNGVLTVTLLKRDEQETSRKIQVAHNRDQGASSDQSTRHEQQSNKPSK